MENCSDPTKTKKENGDKKKQKFEVEDKRAVSAISWHNFSGKKSPAVLIGIRNFDLSFFSAAIFDRKDG
jgi:hypothetical protein